MRYRAQQGTPFTCDVVIIYTCLAFFFFQRKKTPPTSQTNYSLGSILGFLLNVQHFNRELKIGVGRNLQVATRPVSQLGVLGDPHRPRVADPHPGHSLEQGFGRHRRSRSIRPEFLRGWDLANH